MAAGSLLWGSSRVFHEFEIAVFWKLGVGALRVFVFVVFGGRWVLMEVVLMVERLFRKERLEFYCILCIS